MVQRHIKKNITIYNVLNIGLDRNLFSETPILIQEIGGELERHLYVVEIQL